MKTIFVLYKPFRYKLSKLITTHRQFDKKFSILSIHQRFRKTLFSILLRVPKLYSLMSFLKRSLCYEFLSFAYVMPHISLYLLKKRPSKRPKKSLHMRFLLPTIRLNFSFCDTKSKADIVNMIVFIVPTIIRDDDFRKPKFQKPSSKIPTNPISTSFFLHSNNSHPTIYIYKSVDLPSLTIATKYISRSRVKFPSSIHTHI